MLQAILSIGDVKFSVEIPEHIAEAVNEHLVLSDIIDFPHWGAIQIADCLRLMIPSEVRPSSSKQIEYAEKIAATLEIPLPDDLKKSDVCGKFIDEHASDFKEAANNQREVEKYMKYIFRQTGRVSRWTKARNIIASGASIELAAEKMQVKPNTIEKYLAELNDWEKFTSGTDEYDVVMRLLVEYDAGVNLYNKYLYGSDENSE